MPSAAENIQAARNLLDRCHNQSGAPSDADIRRATAHAEVAKAASMDRIAVALEALAANTTPAPAIVRGAIRHTV